MNSHEPAKLFENEVEDNEEEDALPDVLNIENDYAIKYNDWRRKEELQKLKDKYGDRLDVMSEIEDNDDGDEPDDRSSDSSSETDSIDEDPFDEDFFKVYSALKADDPKLYDKDFKFFENNLDSSEKETEPKSIKPKPNEKTLTLPEYHQKLVEERKGITEEDELPNAPPKQTNGYYQELSNIKDEIKNIVGDDGDDQEDDDLFTVKETQNKVETSKKETKVKNNFLSTIWNDSKQLDKSEQFLKDYIINERYRDDEKSLLKQARLMANVDGHFGGFDRARDGVDEPEDDEAKASVHVAKYHFEEPDATTIKRFPRNLTSVRDSIKPTASKRAEVRERKRTEKQTELKRLRRLKREEMEAKLAKLKQTAGIETPLDLKTFDLNVIVDEDEEFDPKRYDEKMKLLFGEDYYGEKDNKKPKFDYVPDIDDDLYDNQTDVLAGENDQEAESKKSKKKKTKKEIKQNKDIMADDDIGIYEDIVGNDLATRFRYRMVEPNDFGLTDDEILLADEKELNRWVSLKKMSQHRSKHHEDNDRKIYNQKAADLELKKKILKSLYGDDDEQDIDASEDMKNKKRGKKRRKPKVLKSANSTHFEVTRIDEPEPIGNGDKAHQPRQQKQGRKRKANKNANGFGKRGEDSGEIDRLKAYGMSNRQIKRLKAQL